MQDDTDVPSDVNQKLAIPVNIENQKDQNYQRMNHSRTYADFAGILERKNSLPRNFKLRISTDPDKFASRVSSNNKKDS
jgi:hypothetical protein